MCAMGLIIRLQQNDLNRCHNTEFVFHDEQRNIRRADQRGLQLKTGVEFFLLSPDGAGVADGADRQNKPCYD
jgi:hypothetical protein